jgi:hypothetical protein
MKIKARNGKENKYIGLQLRRLYILTINQES